jgi:hypothetical protein
MNFGGLDVRCLFVVCYGVIVYGESTAAVG